MHGLELKHCVMMNVECMNPMADLPLHRVGWREDQTLSTNYLQNQLVMDPNVDRKGSKQSHKLLPPEERKARGEETFSDDDGV